MATLNVTISDFDPVLYPAALTVQIIPTASNGAATSQKATSNDDGIASFSNVGPGIYSMSVCGLLPSVTLKVPNTGDTLEAIDLITHPLSTATNSEAVRTPLTGMVIDLIT
jgi:hypothetical protein